MFIRNIMRIFLIKTIPRYYSVCVVALMTRELLRRRVVKVLCQSLTAEEGDIHLAGRGRGDVCTEAKGTIPTL